MTKLHMIAFVGFIFIFAPLVGNGNPQECSTKAKLATEILKSREDGDTKEENFEVLNASWQEHQRQGIAVPHYVFVDMKRMVNDVFREHNGKWVHDWDRDEIFSRELEICLSQGF